MIQIDLDAIREAAEAYCHLAEQLEEEKERLEESLGNLTEEVWSGEDADTFRSRMREWMDADFAQGIRQMRGIESELRHVLETGGELKAYGDALPETLDGQVISGILGTGAGGILYFDPEPLGEVVCSTRVMVQETEAIRQRTCEIEKSVGEFANVGNEAAQVRRACDAMQEVDFFCRMLERYGEYMDDFDEDLARRFSVFGSGRAGEAHMNRYRLYGTDGRVSEERLSCLLGMPEEELTEKERADRDRAVEVLFTRKEQETILSLTETVLKKDGEKWSHGEADFAARAWSYCLEGGDCEGIERILQGLGSVEHGSQEAVPVEGDRYGYYIEETYGLDEKKCGRILGELDAFSQGGSYYTLNRAMQCRGKKTLYYYESLPEVSEQFHIKAELVEGEILLRLWVEGEKGESLRAVDMNAVVGQEGIANLERLKFTKEEIRALFASAHNERDMEFVKQLSSASTVEEYGEAFAMNPDELSPYLIQGLNGYGYLLLEKGLSTDQSGRIAEQNLKDFETFVNGLLYRKPQWSQEILFSPEGEEFRLNQLNDNHTEAYLKHLQEESRKAMEISAGVLYENYNDQEVCVRSGLSFQKQAGLSALYQVLADARSNDLSVDETNCFFYFQMEDLRFSETATGKAASLPGFELCLQEYGNGVPLGEPLRVGGKAVLPDIASKQAELENYRNAKKEADWAVPKMMGRLTVKGIVTFVPGLSNVKEMLGAAGDVKKIGSAATALVKEVAGSSKLEKGSSLGKDVYEGIWDAYCAYQEKEAADKELVDDLFQDGILMERNGTDSLLSRGQYCVNTILKEAYLKHEGICFLGGTQEEGEKIFEDYLDLIYLKLSKMNAEAFYGLDQPEKLDMLGVVWCGKPYREDSSLTVPDLSNEQLIECIKLLNEVPELKEYLQAESFLAAYQRYVVPVDMEEGE